MKRFEVYVSQNGWEYTGTYTIKCNKSVEKIRCEDENRLLIDNEIEIEFDEEVSSEIKEIK